MIDFFATYWPSIVLSIFSIIVIPTIMGATRHIKNLYANEIQRKLDEVMDEKLGKLSGKLTEQLSEQNNNIKAQIDDLKAQLSELSVSVDENRKKDEATREALIQSQRIQFIHLCHNYMTRPSLTKEEYDYVVDQHRIYKDLGGNGEIKDYYDRVKNLPIRD